MKLVYQYIIIFFNFSLTSDHFHSLQVENCDSNSRLVVDEDDYGKLRLERVNNPALASERNLLLQFVLYCYNLYFIVTIGQKIYLYQYHTQHESMSTFPDGHHLKWPIIGMFTCIWQYLCYNLSQPVCKYELIGRIWIYGSL